LIKFQKQFKLSETTIKKVIGPNDPNKCYENPDACGEANLDVQYIMGVAQVAPTTYWFVPGDVEPFTAWIMSVADESKPPLVHSISYGGYETDHTDKDKIAFTQEAQKLGLRGVTVLASSGDDGASNYNLRNDSTKCGYSVSFPASCPYVTSVGATQGPEDKVSEIACSSDSGGLITTGGGFSDFFKMPGYQTSTVPGYFTRVTSKPYPGYQKEGRGVPDVAALGHNYAIVIGGNFTLVSGTSASSPVFGGIVSLANDCRMKKGKQPLGFLNQALYKAPVDVWNDILVGNNKCAAEGKTKTNCCKQGFTCSIGWDPLTGLGTPVFPKLYDYLCNL